MLILFENLSLAIQSLKSNPLRSILTLIGIAVGIGAVLYVVVLGEITRQRINARLESLGSNILMIRPERSHRYGVRSANTVINLKWSDAVEILQSSAVITNVIPYYYASANSEFEDQNYNTRINGTVPAYVTVNNEKIAQGRFFNEEEMKYRRRVCVLGATAHENLFGSASPVGKAIFINSKRFEVLGLLSAKGESWSSPDEQIFIPLTTAQDRIFGVDYLSGILAQMKSAEDFDEALFDIEMILRRNHRLRPDQDNDFRVRRQDLYLATIQDTNKEIANFIIMIALISLIVGGIGIANVMLVAVTERTREIGIRRAIGAKKSSILIQFLTEAATLGVFGGIFGIIGGTVFNQIYVASSLILPIHWIAYSFIICAGIGVAAGIYPALRAANENVIDALRYE